MIRYSIATVSSTVTREDGTQETATKRGPLKVWFSQSDPATDEPDQTYDWRAAGDELTWAQNRHPIQVKSVCAKREIDAELSGSQPFNQYVFEIYRDLMTEQIERV